MVGLHVLNHQIVGLTACQGLFHIAQPLSGLGCVDGVHNGDLLVQDHIRVIGHAVGHNILTLKQVYLMVIGAYI